MSAEDYDVTGIYVYGYLTALKKISGQNFARLLKQGNLEQYVEKNPPPTMAYVAKGSQIIAMNREVLRIIGPDLSRLFQSNLSREFARQFCTNRRIQAEFAAIMQSQSVKENLLLEVSRLLAQKIGGFATEKLNVQSGPQTSTVIVTYTDSIYCAHLGRAEQPVCTNVILFWKDTLSHFVGKQVYVKEIECSKVSGDHDCKFLIS